MPMLSKSLTIITASMFYTRPRFVPRPNLSLLLLLALHQLLLVVYIYFRLVTLDLAAQNGRSPGIEGANRDNWYARLNTPTLRIRIIIVFSGGTICMQHSEDGLVPV